MRRVIQRLGSIAPRLPARQACLRVNRTLLKRAEPQTGAFLVQRRAFSTEFQKAEDPIIENAPIEGEALKKTIEDGKESFTTVPALIYCPRTQKLRELATNEPEKAIPQLGQIIVETEQTGKINLDSMATLVVALENAGRFADAINLANELFIIANEEFLFDRALYPRVIECYRQLGQVEAVITLCQSALEKSAEIKNSRKRMLIRANLHLEWGISEMARRGYYEAIQQFQKSIKYFEEVDEVKPSYAVQEYLAAALYYVGESQKAFDMLLKVFQNTGDLAPASFQVMSDYALTVQSNVHVAVTWLEMGMQNEVFKSMISAEEGPYLQIPRLYASYGLFKDAMYSYDRYVENFLPDSRPDPNGPINYDVIPMPSWDTARSWSWALIRSDRIDEAEAVLDSAEKQDVKGTVPDKMIAFSRLAIARGKFDEAASLLQTALDSDPESEVYQKFICLRFQQGRYEDAMKLLVEAQSRKDLVEKEKQYYYDIFDQRASKFLPTDPKILNRALSLGLHLGATITPPHYSTLLLQAIIAYMDGKTTQATDLLIKSINKRPELADQIRAHYDAMVKLADTQKQAQN